GLFWMPAVGSVGGVRRPAPSAVDCLAGMGFAPSHFILRGWAFPPNGRGRAVLEFRRRRLPMAKTTADLLVERLIDWGVDTIFGFPGDGVNGIFEALRTRQEKIHFVQVRHEEA